MNAAGPLDLTTFAASEQAGTSSRYLLGAPPRIKSIRKQLTK